MTTRDICDIFVTLGDIIVFFYSPILFMRSFIQVRFAPMQISYVSMASSPPIMWKPGAHLCVSDISYIVFYEIYIIHHIHFVWYKIYHTRSLEAFWALTSVFFGSLSLGKLDFCFHAFGTQPVWHTPVSVKHLFFGKNTNTETDSSFLGLRRTHLHCSKMFSKVKTQTQRRIHKHRDSLALLQDVLKGRLKQAVAHLVPKCHRMRMRYMTLWQRCWPVAMILW